MLELHTSAIGVTAQKVLSEAHRAAIAGITSRGIFLRVEPRDIIFLSYETYKGPLTLSLGRNIAIQSRLRQSEHLELHDGKLCFINTGITIFTQGAEHWEPPSPPNSCLEPAERNQRIRAVASMMLAERNPEGLGRSLVEFLGIESPNRAPLALPDPIVDLRELQHVIHRPDIPKIESALQPLLGLGTGLTPSGDDLIIGLLLAYNRWRDITDPPFALSEVNKAIIRLAFQRTTLISANLITCAAQGLADERLILAMDGLVSDYADLSACAHALLNWGSSSGFDTLAGMALAISQEPA